MKDLQLSRDLSLPLKAVTEKLAWLGRTGSGKTYGAIKLAELMLEAGAQIGALDPVGVWRALRVPATRSGRSFEVVVFGGLYGDLPLEPTAGALIADLVCDRGFSFVLDVSQFIPSEQQRFVHAFADRFFHLKKAKPGAVHLFMEECQEFIPENPSGLEAMTLGVMQRLWKLGRNFGIGGSLISQRPQEIAKKALNMSGTLFAFQMTGPQERKAVKAWVADQGIAVDIESVLQKLDIGQPHVESPTFLKVSKTIRILPRVTADLSSTPEVGVATAAARALTPIDIENLKTSMAATIQKQKADDPVLLRKRIAELEREAKKVPAATPTMAPKVVERPILKDGQVKRLEAAVERLLTETARMADQVAQRQQVVVTEAGNLRTEIKAALSAARIGGGHVESAITHVAGRKPEGAGSRDAALAGRDRPAHTPTVRETVQRGPMGQARERILAALAMRGPLSRPALGVFAVMASTGGTFNTYVPQLIREGAIESDGRALSITAHGRSLLSGEPERIAPKTGALVRAAWRDNLSAGGMQAIFDALVDAYPDSITRPELGERAGMSSTGGTFNTYFPKLARLGLVFTDRDRKVSATAELFQDAE